MGRLIFFVKTLVLTFIVILFMQIRVGQLTLEERTMNWVHNSTLIKPLHQVVQGGVKLVREGWSTVSKSFKFDTPFMKSIDKENIPGYREVKFQMSRSKKFIEEKAQEAHNQNVEEDEEDVFN